MTLTDFLLARIAEDEAVAREADRDYTNGGGLRYEETGYNMTPDLTVDPARVLAECEAKRRIVEWHKSWPVLVETPPKFDQIPSHDANGFAFRASQQMAWFTGQEYRDRFGSEPPTGPVLRLLALPYADHPDYREEWKP